MGRDLVAEHGTGVQIVYLAGFCATVLPTVVDPHVRFEFAWAEGKLVDASRKVLGVYVLQLGVKIAKGQRVRPAIVTAHEVKAFRAGAPFEAAIGRRQ
ncbi:hypothetical protein D9M71_818450 [compost metagenome]